MKLSNLSSKKLIKALLKSGFEYAPIKGKGNHVALLRIDSPENLSLSFQKEIPFQLVPLNQ